MNELKDAYEDRINSIIKSLENKIVVFDFDGTLTELKYDSNRLLPCNQNDIEDYSIKHNTIYNRLRVLKTMQYIMARLSSKNIYVLTTTTPSLIRGKQIAIMDNFPNIEYDNVIHVFKDDVKVAELEKIVKNHCKEVVYIDDNLYTLLKVEETLEHVTGIHISSLIA